MFTVFIKIFGIVALALWLLYPKKLQFILYSILWFVLLTVVPLFVVSPGDLLAQYQNWSYVVRNDHTNSYGASFIGILHSWFNVEVPKLGIIVIAAIVFCLPLLRVKLYSLYVFRAHILASILLWIVVFNHKGESPTYIIAMAGAGIWYFTQQKNKVNTMLLLLALVFTSFSSTDLITPGWIATKYIEPYSIKAVFCFIIWAKLITDLLKFESKESIPKLSVAAER
jgi:hypothetical protein